MLRKGVKPVGKTKFEDIDNAKRENRAIRLVRLSWLRKKAQLLRAAPDDGVARRALALRRRQELEQDEREAFLDVEELEAIEETIGVRTDKRIPLGAWSYCWETPGHPDPAGSALLQFDDEIGRMQAEPRADFFGEMGVFIDWCSMHQHAHATPVFQTTDVNRHARLSHRKGGGGEKIVLSEAQSGLNKRPFEALWGVAEEDTPGADAYGKEWIVQTVEAHVGGQVVLKLAGRTSKTMSIKNPATRREPLHEALFKIALGKVYLCYAHARVTVWVLSDTAPMRPHGYFDSGWPTFVGA